MIMKNYCGLGRMCNEAGLWFFWVKENDIRRINELVILGNATGMTWQVCSVLNNFNPNISINLCLWCLFFQFSLFHSVTELTLKLRDEQLKYLLFSSSFKFTKYLNGRGIN